MTDNEALGRHMMAYIRAGSVQRRLADEVLGIIERRESPDAGKPWTPQDRPYAPPEGIAEAKEMGE